ncbi:hypothetical protein [Acetobacter sp.]|jgi:hypothetical protein|uniref:hypothetical protein n=1 Tax=Acetobacter sp. TaxID=440 RepID=UPI0025B9B367|nr:hypothetical protein [Acetobacter sp.]MCH4091822.1 hypothetical protein [Acetobacter sp.]MCI1300322.1 hypothetical protein [Acetobacter sp.]MCI1316860.1 hypothetical protein [Acetobacter sp.]
MADLSDEDEKLLQQEAGLTPETIRTIAALGFTLTRTASLLSYIKDLADEAEQRGSPKRTAGPPDC